MSSSALVPADKQLSGLLESFKKTVGDVFRYTSSGTSTAPISETTFLKRWQEAETCNREANWNQLPEDIFDQLEQQGGQLTADDTRFLARQIAQSSTPTVSAIAAIRLLGILAEESFVSRDQAFQILRDSLFHQDANCRYYAVKSLWQADDKKALRSLRRVVERDPAEKVQAMAKRAIVALS